MIHHYFTTYYILLLLLHKFTYEYINILFMACIILVVATFSLHKNRGFLFQHNIIDKHQKRKYYLSLILDYIFHIIPLCP